MYLLGSHQTVIFGLAKKKLQSSKLWSRQKGIQVALHSEIWLNERVWVSQLSNEKKSCLGYIGDYTTQLYGDYNKPL